MPMLGWMDAGDWEWGYEVDAAVHNPWNDWDEASAPMMQVTVLDEEERGLLRTCLGTLHLLLEQQLRSVGATTIGLSDMERAIKILEDPERPFEKT